MSAGIGQRSGSSGWPLAAANPSNIQSGSAFARGYLPCGTWSDGAVRKFHVHREKVHAEVEMHYAKKDALPVRKNADLMDISQGDFFETSCSVQHS